MRFDSISSSRFTCCIASIDDDRLGEYRVQFFRSLQSLNQWHGSELRENLMGFNDSIDSRLGILGLQMLILVRHSYRLDTTTDKSIPESGMFGMRSDDSQMMSGGRFFESVKTPLIIR